KILALQPIENASGEELKDVYNVLSAYLVHFEKQKNVPALELQAAINPIIKWHFLSDINKISLSHETAFQNVMESLFKSPAAQDMFILLLGYLERYIKNYCLKFTEH